MKLKKLIPMVDFILDIEWMTTTEFCNETGAPLPTIKGGSDSFLQIDAIKHRLFVEYANFLNKNLTDEMFIGDNPTFPGFVKCTPAEAEKKDILNSFDNFGKDEYMIRMYRNYEANGVTKKAFVTSFHLKKVNDIVTFGMQYNGR
jgi:hypothetical protein